MNKVDLFTDADVKLAEHAEVIRALGKRAVHDIIEIGRRLIDAKELAGHGNWLSWLDGEFGWGVDTAQNFMNVANAASKFGNFPNLNLPISGLYLLAAPSTPAEVIEAVAERSDAGERLTLAEVREKVEAAQETVRSETKAEIERLTKARDDVAREAEERLREENLIVSPEELEAKVSEAMAPFEAKIAELKESVKRYKQRLKKAEEQLEGGPKSLDPKEMQADAAVRYSLRKLADDIGKVQPEAMIAYARRVSPIINRSVPQFLADTPAHAEIVTAWAARFLELAKGET